MIRIRKSSARGNADHGWLRSKHSFSFAEYYDEKFMGHGPLRVINEDRIAGGTGFGTHSHQNMEILSYVMKGALQHKDSMGNETIIMPGEVQLLSAGTGIRHSEYNHQKEEETHFLQIWVLPDAKNLSPSYGQKSFQAALGCGNPLLVCSKSGRDGSIAIHQDLDLYICQAALGGNKQHATSKHRKLWLQVLSGSVELFENSLSAGDGAAISDVESISLIWKKDSEFLLFDMAS